MLPSTGRTQWIGAGCWLLLGVLLPATASAQLGLERILARRSGSTDQCVPKPAGSKIEALPMVTCEGIGDPQPLTISEGPVGQGPWSFQWQRRTKDTEWAAIEGATLAEYDPPRDNYREVRLRRMEINTCGVVYSNEISIPLREQQHLAAPGPIAGTVRPTAGGVAIYELASPDSTLHYLWHLSGGAIIMSGQGKARLTVRMPAGTQAMGVRLTVAAVSECGSGPVRQMDVVCRPASRRAQPSNRAYANRYRLARGR